MLRATVRVPAGRAVSSQLLMEVLLGPGEANIAHIREKAGVDSRVDFFLGSAFSDPEFIVKSPSKDKLEEAITMINALLDCQRDELMKLAAAPKEKPPAVSSAAAPSNQLASQSFSKVFGPPKRFAVATFAQAVEAKATAPEPAAAPPLAAEEKAPTPVAPTQAGEAKATAPAAASDSFSKVFGDPKRFAAATFAQITAAGFKRQ